MTNSLSISALYCAAAIPLKTFFVEVSGTRYCFDRKQHLYEAGEFLKAFKLNKRTNKYIALLQYLTDVLGPNVFDEIEFQISSWRVSQVTTGPMAVFYSKYPLKGGQHLDTFLKDFYAINLVAFKDPHIKSDYSYEFAFKLLDEMAGKANIVKHQLDYQASGLDLYQELILVEKALDTAVQATEYFKHTVESSHTSKLPSKNAFTVLTYDHNVKEDLYGFTSKLLGIQFFPHFIKPDTLVLSATGNNVGREIALHQLAEDLTDYFVKNKITGPQGNLLSVTT